ncbi:MAG: Uma2 family endonuclease [Planctomycetaceae bacterium]
MSAASTPVEIEYPESDGMPMGETDIHIQWIIRLRDMLKWRYRDQQTYVAADLLVYYEEGDPKRCVVPDVFVVKDCDPGPRRVYKVWEEPAPPQFVMEVTSRGSKREDLIYKPRVYDHIGVSEYFLYDPTSEYLKPPLQGFRRTGGQFSAIEPDSGGWLASEQLELRLRLESGWLILQDAATGDVLLTEGEAERAARKAAEAEVASLRERLRQSGQDV